jgi:hypothetical protein
MEAVRVLVVAARLKATYTRKLVVRKEGGKVIVRNGAPIVACLNPARFVKRAI